MRFIFVIAVLIFSHTIYSNTTYIRKIKLPWEAKKLINQEFKRWDYFNSTIPYMDSSGVMKAWEYADLIKADFNEDSKDDFAALVKPYNTEYGFLVILIASESGFNFIKLKKIPYYRDRLLYLAKKGSRLFDFNIEKEFVLPSDGVALAIYEKSSTTYYMVNSKFIEATTSD